MRKIDYKRQKEHHLIHSVDSAFVFQPVVMTLRRCNLKYLEKSGEFDAGLTVATL